MNAEEEKTKCEICGHEMVHFHEGSNGGEKCPNCGWGYVTTMFPDTIADETIYGIYLLGPQTASRAALKTVSEIINSNYLAAKKALDSESGNLLIAECALKIKRFARSLNEVGVRYEIRPPFPHDVDDHSDDNYVV